MSKDVTKLPKGEVIEKPSQFRTIGPMANVKPADPLEHLHKYKCDKGHSDWDKDSMVFSIDHKAYILRCMSCDDRYVIHIGGYLPLPAPDGLVPA